MVIIAAQFEDYVAREVEALAKKRGITPADLLQNLAEAEIRRNLKFDQWAREDAEAYKRQPEQPGEFMDADEERAWLKDEF